MVKIPKEQNLKGKKHNMSGQVFEWTEHLHCKVSDHCLNV